MRGHLRGRKPLKKLFAFLATFCMLSGALALVNLIKTEAAGEYHINITSNDTSMGGFGYGSDCTGTIYSTYQAQADNNWTKPFPNGGNVITACPASGYYFDHWLVNGQRAGTNPTQAQFYSYYSDVVYDSNNEINIEAVFIDAFSVVASVDAGVGGTIQMGWISPSGYTAVPINGTATNEITFSVPNTGNSVTTDTITATPDQGYTFAGVTTSGANVVYNDLGNNQFTLTISGDGTATVLFAPIAVNTAEIYISNGTLNAWGNDVTVTNNQTAHVTAAARGTQTLTVQASPSSGYRVNTSNPVSTTGSVTYNNDYNNGQFTLSIAGNGTATVNLEQITYTATIDAGAGTATVPTSANYTVTNNGTSTVTVTSTSTNISVPVSITPPSGNVVDSVSATGSAGYNGDLNGNDFSFTITGDGGQVSVSYTPAAEPYNVLLDAGSGTVSVASGTGYTVANNNTGLVTVTTSGNTTTGTITVNAPSGYMLSPSNPITSTNGTTTYSNLSGNTLTLSMTGADTVTFNYISGSPYVASFDVSPSAGGTLKEGWSCNGSTISNLPYTSTSSNPEVVYRNDNAITACPESGYRFVGWRISGDNIDTFDITSSNNLSSFNQWMGGSDIYQRMFANDTHNVTVTALFEATDTVTVNVNNSSMGQIKINNTTDQYTAQPNNTDTSTITLVYPTASAPLVTNSLIIEPANGYVLDHIESTSGNTTWTQAGINEYTLTLAGDDTVTVVFVQKPSYTVDFVSNNPSVGQLKLASGSDYTASPDDTDSGSITLTTVTGTGTTTTSTLYNTVSSGYFLDHFESSTGATVVERANGGSERDYVATISDTDTVTAYFVAYSDVVYTVSVNYPEAGSIDVNGGGCQDPSKKTNQSFTKNLKDIGNNWGQSRLDIGDDIATIDQCVDNPNYVFDHWEIDNMTFGNTSLDPVGYWPKTGTYHTLRAVFSPKINYLDGVVLDQGTTIAPIEPGTTTAKYSDKGISPTGVSYDANSLPSGVKFAGWEEVVNNCNPGECAIVSTDSTFIPSGEQIYAGATYRAVFVQDNTYTEVTVAVPGEGYISYWSNSQSQFVDVSDNGEFHVATVNGYVDGPIKATPQPGYVFDHWEYNGQRIGNGVTIDDNELQYQAGSNGKLAQLVAYFRTGVTYHAFTGYTGADGYYDHDLPETRRGNNQGSQGGAVVETYIADADSDIMAATATFSGEQHPTAPNGYYFAYWITGCNTDYSFVEQVDDGYGILIDYNTLQNETIVSTSTYFRPTRDQANQCNEYIAVFYRKNQLRLIAQSENEAIGVVNATTRSSSEYYQQFCDNTLMRVKANVGVGVNANGFYSSCDPMVVITNPSYELDYWTINGSTVVFDSSGNVVRDYTFRDPSADNYTGFTILGDQVNYLVAHYRLKTLPHTGSIAIWFIVGGGVAAVAIPSVILLISERKEQKKGGKK